MENGAWDRAGKIAEKVYAQPKDTNGINRIYTIQKDGIIPNSAIKNSYTRINDWVFWHEKLNGRW
jgi:hypothetical protein